MEATAIPVGMEGLRVYRHGPHTADRWGVGVVTVDDGGHCVYAEFPAVNRYPGDRDGWFARASLIPVEPLTEYQSALRAYGLAIKCRNTIREHMRNADDAVTKAADALFGLIDARSGP